MSADLELLR